MMTRAPSATNASTADSPIPEAPPVTTATLPSNLPKRVPSPISDCRQSMKLPGPLRYGLAACSGVVPLAAPSASPATNSRLSRALVIRMTHVLPVTVASSRETAGPWKTG